MFSKRNLDFCYVPPISPNIGGNARYATKYAVNSILKGSIIDKMLIVYTKPSYNPSMALLVLDKYVTMNPPKISINIDKISDKGISGKNMPKYSYKISNNYGNNWMYLFMNTPQI